MITEKLGIPDGINEGALLIFTNIKNNITNKNINYIKINDIIMINNIVFNQTKITLRINKSLKNSIMALSKFELEKKYDRTRVFYKIDDKIEIDILVNLNNIDLIDFLEQNKDYVLSILAHELKHVYDIRYISGTLYTKNKLIEYHTYHELYNDYPTYTIIDDFIYYLYLSSNFEKSVQPAEMGIKIKENKITKSSFIEFLKKDKQYQTLIEMKTFSLERMKKELQKDLTKVCNFLDKHKILYDNPVTAILEWYKYLITDSIIKKDNSIKTINNIDQFYNFNIDKINNMANLTIKKIVKLVDLCEVDEKTKKYESLKLNTFTLYKRL